ncbi:MAG: corA [Bacillales bacterium]|jgi:magnesium transporter|nr:corA [Bacillales bacterium]
MINIIAYKKDKSYLKLNTLDDLNNDQYIWYWVDFCNPDESDIEILKNSFNFHPLSIEDCIYDFQRPKLDVYDDYYFFVFHAVDINSTKFSEVNIFVREKSLVTFHKDGCLQIDNLINNILITDNNIEIQNIWFELLDTIVDNYFPVMYRIEDCINDLEVSIDKSNIEAILSELFNIRSELATLRRSILPMRELLYKILNDRTLEFKNTKFEYFRDIHDHLVALTEMVEGSREFTSDIRDNYLSMNSFRMNSIMKTLTIITTLFMPLSFIAGIYGMNFINMPELRYKYGYYILIGFMLIIVLLMLSWFKRRKWI